MAGVGDEEIDEPGNKRAQVAMRVLERVRAEQHRIRQVRLPPDYQLEDEPLPASPLFAWLKASNCIEEFTNFNSVEIEALWRPVDAIMEAEKHRGPNAHTSTLDHLILYLMWLKTGATYRHLAAIAEMSENKVEDNLNRVRFPLWESLRKRWWDRPKRPKIRVGSSLPPIGLIIDAHTLEIGTPKTDYRNAKRWFDGKNRISLIL
jgi:hypothetical protein